MALDTQSSNHLSVGFYYFVVFLLHCEHLIGSHLFTRQDAYHQHCHRERSSLLMSVPWHWDQRVSDSCPELICEGWRVVDLENFFLAHQSWGFGEGAGLGLLFPAWPDLEFCLCLGCCGAQELPGEEGEFPVPLALPRFRSPSRPHTQPPILRVGLCLAGCICSTLTTCVCRARCSEP